MSQTYPSILPGQSLQSSRVPLMQRDDALRSSFSGTSFPSDAPIGQTCFRLDIPTLAGGLYQFVDDTPITWALIRDFSKNPLHLEEAVALFAGINHNHDGTYSFSNHTHSGVYQPQANNLTYLSGLTAIADRLPYFNSGSTMALSTLTAVGRAIIGSSTEQAARTALGVQISEVHSFLAANGLSTARSAIGLGTLATLSSVTSGELATGAVVPAACASQVIAYDIPFNAGMGFDFNGQNLAVQTYSEIVISRNINVTGEVGYIDTPATGGAVIVDILKNGATIYQTKPQFAASANTMSAGTINTPAFAIGDRMTFKVTQIGSSTPGQKLRFTIKAQVT